jgi:hypothetical protein
MSARHVLSSVEVEYYRRALEDNGSVELRHECDGLCWEAGLWFDNLDDLRTEIWRRQDAGNLYTSLNRPASVKRGLALRDESVEIITRLPFDVDRAGSPKAPATDAELAAAAAGRDLLVRVLTAHGWPVPALGMSGNGSHALYRTRLRATEDWRESSAVLYAGLRQHLHKQFEELRVNLDASVRNAGRVWRAYGTLNRKGPNTPERPHRRARIVLPAGAWQVVRAEVVNRTIDSLGPIPEPPRVFSLLKLDRPAAGNPRNVRMSRGDLRTLDVVSLFEGRGLYRRPLEPGKHAVSCPWASEHSCGHPEDTSTVIREGVGNCWPTFHCSHQHCEGRKIADVLTLWPEHDQYCARRWGCS